MVMFKIKLKITQNTESCYCYCSFAKSCPTLCDPWAAECQASLFFIVSLHLLKFMCIESVLPCNHLILCCPLLLLPFSLPRITVFSSESALCIRWPKCWSCSISPSSEYSGLISFRIDWFDLLAVQGTLKSLLQHHSSKCQFISSPISLWSSSHIQTQLMEKP